jgi:AraC-like DNA-binding protein
MTRRSIFNVNKATHLYHTEQYSLEKVAEQMGCSRTTIANYFRKNGIKIRRSTDHNHEWWSTKTPSERKEQMQKAWRAHRERKYSVEEHKKRALTIYQKQLGIMEREQKLHDHLRPYIENPILLQYNIHTYNVDIVLPLDLIAIEMQKAHLGKSASTKKERIAKLVELGWRVIICYCTRAAHYDYEQTAKTIIQNRQKIANGEPGFVVLYYTGLPTKAYDHQYDLPKLSL